MKRYFINIILPILILAYKAEAQKPSSFEGRHFFVGFMQNENMIEDINWGIDLFIYISCKDTAKVYMIQKDQDTSFYTLPPNQVHLFSLPPSFENRTSELKTKQLVEIISDEPLVVYAYSSQRATSEAYAVIPVDYWGTEYQAMCFPNDQYFLGNTQLSVEDSLYFYTPRSGEFMIMASENNTTVRFFPKAVTRLGKQIDREYVVNMNRGESYLVQSHLTPRYTADLSGTIIKSDKPVGVLSGHVRTAVPQIESLNYDSKNHLVEMLPPQSSWGKQFITVPFSVTGARPSCLYRIVASEPMTTITYNNDNGLSTFTLANPGDVYTVNKLDIPTTWESDKPIQIAQYMRRNDTPQEDSPLYDPAMVIIPPLEQSVQRTFFTTVGRVPSGGFTWDNFREHKVSLIVNREALYSVQIDGKYVDAISNIRTQQIPGMPYYYAHILLDTGTHEIITSKGSFLATSYGSGGRDAYAMILGASLNNPFKNDITPPKYTVDTNCYQLSGKFWDPRNAETTGLFYIKVDNIKTKNFYYNIDPVTDSSEFVNFTAEPIDLSINGSIALEAVDKNGNKASYYYEYKALKVFVDGDLQFGKVQWTDSVCKEIKIVNLSPERYFTIDSASIYNDKRLTYRLKDATRKFPVVLKPYDSVTIVVCFAPNKKEDTLRADFKLFFECDSVYAIPAFAEVLTQSLTVIGWDFGNVFLDESKLGKVLIINNGKTPVSVDSVAVRDSLDFAYTRLALPRMLKEGDTLTCYVDFKPSERKLYIDNYIVYSKDVIDSLTAIVRGRGIAPEVNSILIDWGTRRAGTVNDTISALTNKGNWDADISFSSFINKFGDDELADSVQKIKAVIAALESDTLSFTYRPQQRDAMNIKAYLKELNWKKSDSILIELKGQSVLPDLRLYDADMGNVKIGSTNSKYHKAVLSNGNEKLLIFEMAADSGDIGAFTIDLQSVKNRIININDSLNLDIEFQPQRLGFHKMRVKVTHDAGEYVNNQAQKLVSYFYVYGNGLSKDSASAKSSLTGPEFITACVENELKYSVTNSGNIKIVLNDIILDGINCRANWKTNPNIPDTIGIGETKNYYIEVLALNRNASQVSVAIIYNDSLAMNDKISPEVKANKIDIDFIEKFEVQPGDTITMLFTGTFPNKIDTAAVFGVEFEYDRNFLNLQSTGAEVLIRDKDGDKVYNATLKDLNNKITAELGKKIKISEGAEWRLPLKFMALLDTVKESKITIKSFMDECFEENTMEIPLNISGICIFDLRSVQIIANLYSLMISPNPATENLNIYLKMPEDNRVEFKIFDQTGKKVAIFDNLDLKKGEHYLTYKVENVPNGVYVLSMNAGNFVKNLIFVINK